jgi:hypothetical protein
MKAHEWLARYTVSLNSMVAVWAMKQHGIFFKYIFCK